VTIMEKLAKDTHGSVQNQQLLVADTLFTIAESARLARALYGPETVKCGPSRRNMQFGCLAEFAEWWRQHPIENSDAEHLAAQVIAGEIDPLSAQTWAVINSWHDLARALISAADEWSA